MQRVELTEDLSFSRIIHGLWRLSEWNMSNEEVVRTYRGMFKSRHYNL